MIPINISRPQDIAIIFALFALVVITIGFGVQSIEDNQNVTVDNSFFQNVTYGVESSSGLKGSSDDVSAGLIGQEGASTTPSEESILLTGFNSILKLGKTFKTMSGALMEGVTMLGVPLVYWILFTSIILISFAVVMYTWIRGR